MRLDRYLAKFRIVDLKSTELEGALTELLKISAKRNSEDLDIDQVLTQLLEREESMTTYLGNGVAMPHIRLPMNRPYIFAVGRCMNGLNYEGSPQFKEVRLVFLILASERDTNYLNVLAALARLFRERKLVDDIIASQSLEEFKDRVYQGFGGILSKPERRQNRFNRVLLRETEKIAKAARCTAILVFSDTFVGGIEVTSAFPNFRTILVTRAATERYLGERNVEGVIEVRAYSNQRLSQLRSAILIGLTREVFKHNDRLCCIGGLPNSNQLDTIVIVDVEREFQSVLTRETGLVPDDVKVEVVERIFAVATELAVEGREGKPVGTLFVLGDTERVETMVKPLIMNPFYGYKEEDRNVLNPFMDETLKELASIDGAFIIRGDGVVESAGTLLHVPSEFHQELPGGYGARHSAAAAISRAADCLTITVSSSNGQVTLFRRGAMLPLFDRSGGQSV